MRAPLNDGVFYKGALIYERALRALFMMALYMRALYMRALYLRPLFHADLPTAAVRAGKLRVQ